MEFIGTEAQEKWARELLAARKRSNDDAYAFKHFISLVEKANSGGLFEAKALIATITNTPEDNGEGEAVLSLLSAYPSNIRIRAILEALPRFLKEAESAWAETVIETEARFHSDELISCGKEAENEVREVLIIILKRISAGTIQHGEVDFASSLVKLLENQLQNK
jgi:hypothetical protein